MLNEKESIIKVSKEIQKYELSDYKCFISERKALNHAQYTATICVIVPVHLGEKVLKEIMRFTPEFEFKSSQVETSDERGVDILLFETILNYKEDEDD
jgi:hypothetical protein